MDRKSFLGLIGCGAGAALLGVALPAPEPVGLESSPIGRIPNRWYNAAWKDMEGAYPMWEGTYGGAAGGGKTNAALADIDRLLRQYYGPMIEHEIQRPTLMEMFDT